MSIYLWNGIGNISRDSILYRLHALRVALGVKMKTGQLVFISDFVMLDLLLAVSLPNFIDSYSLYKVKEGFPTGGFFRTRRRLSAFQQLTTNKTAATESTKVGYLYGLTTTWTSCHSFAEKQKVGGVSGNPTPSGNPLRYLNL